MEKQKILLTGASGTIGYQVLSQLVDNVEYRVSVFDVKSSKAEKLFAPFINKIDIFYGDIRNPLEVKIAVKGKHRIIHLAALIPPLADENPPLAEAINIEGTKNILEAMDKEAFLLYASSISVYGDRIENPMITTEDPLFASPYDEYALTKIAAERLVKDSDKQWSIFRLSAVMGYGNHKVSPLMFHMPLKTPMEIITPEDTARAFVNALEHKEKLLFRIFNLGGGENNRILYKDFLQRSFHIFGLGEFNFPAKAFAEKNFHCGYYADGDELEDILHFRKETLATYFAKVKANFSPIKRFFATLFRGVIKKHLLKKSEPYRAYLTKDSNLMARFFNNK